MQPIIISLSPEQLAGSMSASGAVQILIRERPGWTEQQDPALRFTVDLRPSSLSSWYPIDADVEVRER